MRPGRGSIISSMNTKVKDSMLSTERPVGVQSLLRVLVGSVFILVHSAPDETVAVPDEFHVPWSGGNEKLVGRE